MKNLFVIEGERLSCHGLVIWQLDLQLPVQSVPITTKVVSSNPAQGELFSMLFYVINLSLTCGRSVVFYM
jgi:hypothetical protein